MIKSLLVRSLKKNIYFFKKKPATLSLYKGFSVYGEKIIKKNKKEFRLWDPNRSKLAAAILKGLKQVPIKQGYSILYLGAASGTTASHVSDLVGKMELCIVSSFLHTL